MLSQVFEINSGILRNKSQLMSRLKEVSLSHQVKPCIWPVRGSQKSGTTYSKTVILIDEVCVSFVNGATNPLSQA